MDFSAYPVIRIDQISLLSQSKLVQAIDDVNLILSEKSSRENSALNGYLQKQLLLMQKELDGKQAEERVALVLMGLSNKYGPEPVMAHNETLSNLVSNISQPVSIISKEKGKNGHDNIKDEVTAVLISRSAPNTPFNIEGNEKKLLHSANTVESDVTSSSTICSDALKVVAPHLLKQRTEKILGGRSISRISKGSTVLTKAVSSNISFNNVPAVGAAMDVVNKNFGSMFIVAATEKKKRFVVTKKVSPESTEDIKKNEKLERRRQAMQRLLKRQEERKEYHAQMRRLKEDKKRKMSAHLQREEGKFVAFASTEVVGNSVQRMTTVPSRKSFVRSDDSSDTESISGGDDDHGIVIDQKTVESLVAAKEYNDQPPSKRTITSAGCLQHAENYPLSTNVKIATEEDIVIDGKDLVDENLTSLPVDTTVAGNNISEVSLSMLIAQKLLPDQNTHILDDEIEEKNLAALSSLRRLKEKKKESKNNSSPLIVHPPDEQKVVPVRDNTRNPSVQIVEQVTFGLLVYTFNVFHAVVHPLEAWVWVKYPAEDWVIDLCNFNQSKVKVGNGRPSGDYLTSGEVFVSRLGLVLLTKFILHSLPSEFRDSLEFLTSWNRCIAMFDESIDLFLSYVDFGEMFTSKATAAVAAKPAAVKSILIREVNVCANLYQYCQQVNSILVHKNVNNLECRFISSFLAHSVICQSKDELMFDGSSEEVVGTLNQSLETPHVVLYSPPSVEPGDSISNFDQPQENINDYAGPIHQASDTNRSNSIDDGDLGCSDEESIMPVYETQIVPTTVQTAAEGDNKLQIDECIPPPPMLATKERRPKLSDTYSNIGMIFPVAYNQFGLFKQHGGDTSVLAKALLESMHVQAKVYDEWMEVMSDYSTVFCEDREIRENIDNQR